MKDLIQMLNWLREFNIYTVIIRLFLAFILAGIVGFERQKKGHAAGLRTHILVCIGATLTTLTGLFISEGLGFASDPMRIGAQVVSGIGFIGAGTILVTRGTHVRGLTTAAGLWSTAAIGLSLGAGFYEGAIIATLLIALVITIMKKFDRVLSAKSRYLEVYVEINGTKNVNSFLDRLAEYDVRICDIDICAPHSAKVGNVGVTFGISAKKRKSFHSSEIVAFIKAIDGVEIILLS